VPPLFIRVPTPVIRGSSALAFPIVGGEPSSGRLRNLSQKGILRENEKRIFNFLNLRNLQSKNMSTTVPADLKYAKTHEWVRVSGDIATVGISDHAQHELTDVVFVELPAAGRRVKAGESCAVVESVKTASDIYSPVSGEVVTVNPQLAEHPDLVNKQPYGEGWFYTIKLSQPSELNSLLIPADYSKEIGE